jgi:hypothetical protein
MKKIAAAAVCLFLAGCGSAEPEVALADRAPDATAAPAAGPPVCRVAEAGQELPEEVRESSGLAQSRRDPGLFWTHNDANNDPELFAVSADGRLVERVKVAGAELVDWEDIEAGPCEGGSCLYVSDTGDNDGERQEVVIYRIPEPDGGATASAPAEALRARYPDGARDAESMFALPSGDLFLVTKGRRGPIALYRYPAPQRPGEVVTLERVRQLFPEPEDKDDRVTGATASPDGRWVGIRSYRNLYLYRASDLVGGGEAEPTVVDLEPLGEEQGESVVIAGDGSVWMTSEAENKDAHPSLSRLQCTFPDA